MAEMRRWKRALVTGASSGIGDQMARQLAALGTHLVIVARTAGRLEALAAELREAHGVEVEVLAVDLAEESGVDRVERRILATEDPVELVVNNAGFGFNGDVGDVPADDEESVLRVNVLALARLSHAAARRLRPQHWGGILNVSSVASFQPGPGGANYAASKAYVTSYTIALHEELKEHGVHVTTLCPGLTATEFQDRGGWAVNMPGFVWQDAPEVAAEGLHGVAVNKALVVPGAVNKSLHLTSRLLPGAVVRRVARIVTEQTRT